MRTQLHFTATDAAAYVGDDWLLYVDTSGGYARSEMAAPCLQLAQPGALLHVHTDGDATPQRAAALLHASGDSSCSVGANVGAAFLYWDPLSTAGRALTQRCGPRTATPWPGPALPDWEAGWFDTLRHGTADRSAVQAWVARVRKTLLASAPQADSSWQLQAVAALVREDLASRLSVSQLAQHVHWSPEHLRKAFREAACMGLTRYRMWSRLHRLADTLRTGPRDPGGASGSLLDAGFYDAPHGSRAMRRYFGLTARAAMQPRVHHADCHGP